MNRSEADSLIREARVEARKQSEGRPVTPVNFFKREQMIGGEKHATGLVILSSTVNGQSCNVWL